MAIVYITIHLLFSWRCSDYFICRLYDFTQRTFHKIIPTIVFPIKLCDSGHINKKTIKFTKKGLNYLFVTQ